MFANRISHYGGSGGGIRRGLIWTNGVSKPAPEYERLYTPSQAMFRPLVEVAGGVGTDQELYDHEIISLTNTVDDGNITYGDVNYYAYNFNYRTNAPRRGMWISGYYGTTNSFDPAWDLIGGTYYMNYRGQIPFRLVGRAGIYYNESNHTFDELRALTDEMRANISAPSSSILVPTDGSFGDWGRYSGVPLPTVFSADEEEHINTSSMFAASIDKGRMFYSDFTYGNIAILTGIDEQNQKHLYLQYVNFVTPNKVYESSTSFGLYKPSRFTQLWGKPTTRGWQFDTVDRKSVDVSSIVPDLTKISGAGFLWPKLEPGLHYVPLDCYYAVSPRDHGSYIMVFKGYLSFFENRKIITP